MAILGIDIGGSGIKGALVDTDSGQLLTDRIRLKTPAGFPPRGVIATVGELIQEFKYSGPLGVGFPAVVSEGTVTTPATALAVKAWVGVDAAAQISAATGCEVTVVNDADAAGLAEMRFGAGRNVRGVVVVLTLGTGIGSAIFVNGRLVPNSEMGWLYHPDFPDRFELVAADRIREEKDLSWKAWGQRLNLYFNHIERLFSPRLIIIGGGVSKKHDRFLPYIDVSSPVVPAQMRNQAGIVGAAMAGYERD